jgi:hypothetical protein
MRATIDYLCPGCKHGRVVRIEARQDAGWRGYECCSIRADGVMCCSHLKATDYLKSDPPAGWFARYLSGDKQARKEAPIARGLLGYFPNACLHVAHVSYVANEQHNPGLPMQWAFDKSTDEADCQIRHAIDAAGNPIDDDGLLHLAKKAWRACAELERYLLETYPEAKPGASVTGLVRK